MTTAPRTVDKHPGRLSLAENFDPPEPWRSFAVRFLGTEGGRPVRREHSVDHLSDQELRWVARVLTAELERRRHRRI